MKPIYEQGQLPKAPGQRRVLLVDDHPITSQGLAMLLEMEAGVKVCGQVATADQAMKELAACKPDLVIVDIALPGRDGIDLIKDIAAFHPELSVLVVSTMDETIYAERAFRAGAKGYVMKEAPVKLLLQAVHQVMAGEVYLSERMRNNLFHRNLAASGLSASGASGVDQLTDRELEVFRLIGEGLATRRIADELGLSVSTVETHRTHIKEKLGAKRASDLMRQAVTWLRHQQ